MQVTIDIEDRIDELTELSPSEFRVYVLEGQGLSTKEIAARLSIAEKTVNSHVSNILKKLKMTGMRSLYIHSFRQQLIRDLTKFEVTKKSKRWEYKLVEKAA